MNAIILASVFAGAFTIFMTSDPEQVAVAHDQVAQADDAAAELEDKGFMTRDVTVNPETGEEEETMVLGFLDS